MQKTNARPGTRALAWLLALTLLLALLPGAALAAETPASGSYVLMNIPYADFYAAEGGAADAVAQIDAVSSATKSKTMNANLAAGSYHVSDTGEDITGVTYPVYVPDAAALAGCKQVSSKDELFCNASYAYCALTETPAAYKTLTAENGKLQFSAVSAQATEVAGASATLSTSDHHVDIAISVSGLAAVTAANVSAATLHTADGALYGLRHVHEIWRGTSLGFDAEDAYAALQGKTIDRITYYLADGGVYTFATTLQVPYISGVTASVESVDAGAASTSFALEGTLPSDFQASYSVNLAGAAVDAAQGVITLPTDAAFDSYTLTVADKSGKYAPVTASFSLYGYVLMNIPYAAFYAAEKGADDTVAEIDAVSSATKSKTLSSLAAGSYHVSDDGSDITGVIYPVRVSSASALTGYTQVTDADSITCTANLRGTVTTTTYTGKDALFGKPSYAYYVLSEKPASYKTLNVRRGTVSFGAVNTAAAAAEASATLSTDDHHVDYAIAVTGLSGVTASNVAAVTLHTTDNAVFGLRHVYEIWRGTSLGFDVTGDNGDYAALVGKTIDRITYYLTDGSVQYLNVKLLVPTILDTELTVTDAAVSAGKTSLRFSAALPADFDAVYAVADSDAFGCDGSTLTWMGTPAAGSYTLTVTDASGCYAPLSASFTLTTETLSARYNDDRSAPALVAAQGVDAADFAAYLANITSVTVDGVSYAATGRNAVTVVNADGSLNFDAASQGAPVLNHGAVYEISVSSAGSPELRFTADLRFADVDAARYYADDVQWAAKAGVVYGADATTFEPGRACTRAEVVTMLWRAAGTPAPETQTCPFTDVDAARYYYDAVLWAYENGIVLGTSATTFEPERACTRAEVVTMLWRAAETPTPETQTCPFADVDAARYYYDAALWGAQTDVVRGTSATTFSPDESCTRAQVVALLHRSAAAE